MRNTLICTVGTSLFQGNLKYLEQNSNKPENWEAISKYFKGENWINLSKELLKIKPSERILGAEINTIEEARNKKWLEISNLILLISDTPQGKNTGKVLKYYFENRSDLNLKDKVTCETIKQLQDKEPKRFKTEGLRNLVREMGNYIDRFGGENCAIDATGGYKAQIAVAVLLGQALDIPVYYKHDLFNEIIDFPRLPISLDYDLLGRNAHVLTEFEKGEIYPLSDIDNFDDKIRVFFDEIEENGDIFFELNPIGQIYLTSFKLRAIKEIRLEKCPIEERKEPTFRDDHYPEGFKDFVQKVWKDFNWIKTCWSLDYSKQKSIKDKEFFVRPMKESHELIGNFRDKQYGARFRIILYNETLDKMNYAAYLLNLKYQ